jgi:phenylacetate-coenzyme A ligase PaaK-like adenylate-forming protein
MAVLRQAARNAFATFVGIGRGLWLFPLDMTFRTVGLRYGWLKALFTWTPAPLLRGVGRLRAERAAWRATRSVPAYGRFLADNAVDVAGLFPLGILDHLPETDKPSYVDRYGLLERCVGGAVPFAGTTIDESSGSTGTPYNWIRSRREREVAHRNIGFFARYAFGTTPLVTINAFSMGAWAAGFNMSLGMMRHGIVKSIGPDLDKILSTLAYLGPSYRFLISGYPPFLKHLIDEGERRGFPWADYRLDALVGGEGMSEELRDVLLERFLSVYSGYGATDIEIGMAGESPVSIAVRRLARARPEIRRALFGTDARLPMVFQYNPLIHYLEANAAGEVVCTVSRLDLLAPRIRYNVHDSGGIVDFATVRRVLAETGFDLDHLNRASEVHGPRGPLPWARPIPLPFLWIHGRRDATISVMGSNIYPEDLEAVLYADPLIEPRLESFMLSVVDDEAGSPRPAVAIELSDLDGVDDAWRAAAAERLRERLAALNTDYRSSVGEYPAAMLPIVSTYGPGSGPFAGDARRIKQRRIS